MKVRKRIYVGLLLGVLVAVWALKSFCIESYRVPDGEMEQTLLAGEQIVVTKWNYGFRLPQTLVRWPFFHDSLPGLDSRSYLSAPRIPLMRFFSRPVSRNDIAVFNHPQPADASVPVDCRKICISRCVGLPGDTLSLTAGKFYINGCLYRNRPEVVEAYWYDKVNSLPVANALIRSGIKSDDSELIGNRYLRFLTSADYQSAVQQLGCDTLLNPVVLKRDEFQVVLPKAGYPLRLDSLNLPCLYPLIKNHENSRAELRGGRLFIDGEERFSYVFRNDYYWMLSDNRVEGGDSRMFGAVPETHLIGKAGAIWWSVDHTKPLLYSLSFDRIFRMVQ